MGFLEFVSPIIGLFNAFAGGDDEPSSSVTTTASSTAEDTSVQDAEAEKKKKQQALIATNAGASQTSTLNPTGGSDVTQKSLLGL